MSQNQENHEENSPSINLVAQFVKDLTVENPAPIELFQEQESQIETNLGVDVNVVPMQDKFFEVVVFFKVEVKREDKKPFLLEMQYAGIFNIVDAKEEMLPLLLFVQCPHLLFPTARYIIRNMTQEGGLPAFNLQNIDFLDLFKRKVEEHTKEKIIT
jgi:preprotein translocase subunit SecB